MTYYKFVSPGKIYYGAGSLESLSNVPCQRAFITTDQILRELGLPERVEKILHAKGVETRVFDAIEAEPSKGTAWKAFALAQAFEPDLFIGLGGGSSMDVGKVAWRNSNGWRRSTRSPSGIPHNGSCSPWRRPIR